MMPRYRRGRTRVMDDVERFLDDVLSSSPVQLRWRREGEEEPEFRPPTDVQEKEDSYIVRVELPGVDMEDIDISVRGDLLRVRGERRPPERKAREEFERSEIYYGRFRRTIELGETVDAERVEAAFSNGLLEITLPKARVEKQARIEVKPR